jgi:hypothetical protein
LPGIVTVGLPGIWIFVRVKENDHQGISICACLDCGLGRTIGLGRLLRRLLAVLLPL